jgi:hypothetical protein
VPPHEELPIFGVNLDAEERQRYEKIRLEKEGKLFKGEFCHV